MRPTKGIINLANLKVLFIWASFLKKLNLLQMPKIKCKCLHARNPCKDFMHPVFTAVF